MQHLYRKACMGLSLLAAWALMGAGLLAAAPADSNGVSKDPARSRAAASVGAAAEPAARAALTFRSEFFIPDSAYTYSTWDERTIDIYRADLTKFRDTVRIYLNDHVAGVFFTFPIQGRITSSFGYRRMMGHNFHFGTDIKCQTGDSIVAALDGTVRVVRYDRGYGWFVVIAHEGGLETLYGHLSKALVQPGYRIRSGELLGYGGNTGLSTGSHLHFEFRFLGEQFDPARVISFDQGQVLVDHFDLDASWFDHLVELARVKYHLIRRGDTLGHIARRWGTSVGRLCQLNHISTRTLLRPGRSLRVN